MLKKLLETNKVRNNNFHEENQYLNLIDHILLENNHFNGRNGKTIAIFGAALHFSLHDFTIPLLTTKKLAWKTCLRELLWFIKGQTSNHILNKQNVHIWDANSSREFLDSRGLNYQPGDIGPGYGFQWRFFNTPYIDCNTDYSNQGIDQLQYIIDCLKDPNKRNSRRLILTAWNPSQLDKMALPPCHLLAQFNVFDNKLSCSLYQRSADVGLGLPFNIASYSFLTHLLAHHCSLEPGDFYHYLGNTHIYDDHINTLIIQKSRTPIEFPKIKINKLFSNINEYTENNFQIIDYNFHSNLFLNMRQ